MNRIFALEAQILARCLQFRVTLFVTSFTDIKIVGCMLGVAFALICGTTASAKTRHPAFIQSGFQFSQIDRVCVMPLLDNRNVPKPQLDLSPFRPLVMMSLQKRGYNVSDPGCSAGSPEGGASSGKSHWLLTIRVDALFPAGSVLTASLFNTEADKEVWRDTAMPGFGGRYKNALAMSTVGAVPVDQLVRSGIGPVLATFENRKRTSAGVSHAAVETWAVSIQADAIVDRREDRLCHGSLRLSSGIVSFEPDSDIEKWCQKFTFSSVAAGQIKSYGIVNRFWVEGPDTVFHMSVSGKRTYYFQAVHEEEVNNFFAALGPR